MPEPVNPTRLRGRSQMSNRTRAEERIDEIDVSPTKLLADIEQLKGELESARREGEEYLALLQRERAEFNNFRRRTAEERERAFGLAGEDLIRKVLAIADDFDRAIEAKPEAIAADPWVEGVANIGGTDHPEGAIVDELRRGYRLRDRVLRPALVAVAHGSPASSERSD